MPLVHRRAPIEGPSTYFSLPALCLSSSIRLSTTFRRVGRASGPASTITKPEPSGKTSKFPPCVVSKGPLKKGDRSPGHEVRSAKGDGYGHHGCSRHVEELPPVRRPGWRVPACGGHEPPSVRGGGETAHVDLSAAGFVRGIGEPLFVGGQPGPTFVEGRGQECVCPASRRHHSNVASVRNRPLGDDQPAVSREVTRIIEGRQRFGGAASNGGSPLRAPAVSRVGDPPAVPRPDRADVVSGAHELDPGATLDVVNPDLGRPGIDGEPGSADRPGETRGKRKPRLSSKSGVRRPSRPTRTSVWARPPGANTSVPDGESAT